MRTLLQICVLSMLPLQAAGHTMDALAPLEMPERVWVALAGLFGGTGLAVWLIRRRRAASQALAETQRLLRDVSSQRDSLTEQNETLRARVTSIESAMYEVSHDLSSPLVSISGFARSAIRAQSRGQTDQILQYLERVEASAGNMSSLVNAIRTISRIGTEEPQIREVRLSEIVEALKTRLDGLLSEKQVRLTCSQDAFIDTDPGMLSRALQNFVENAALHATHRAGQEIRISATHLAGMTRVSVSDQGPGVPEDLQPRIFALFQRASDARPGRGLGLTIAARLAHQMAGRVGFDTDPGTGSTFWIELPDLRLPARATG